MNDTLLAAVNPEGVAYSLRPAGLVPRALAYLVDSTIIVIILGIVAAIILAAGASPGSWIYLLTMFIIQWFYNVIWEVFGRGATPGKRIFSMKVVADDGSPITPGASFVRSLLRFADTFLGLTLIGVLSIMFSPGFRRLGDWAASTLVVYSGTSYRKALMSSTARKIRRRSPEVVLKGEDKANIISFARRYDSFGPERADEIASRIIPAITPYPDNVISPGEYLLSIGAGLSGEGDKG